MGNFYMESTQINYRRDETLKTVDQKLQELSQESAIDTDIAPVFKSTSTYNPGDLVYYRNKLYKCTNQHTGAWAAGDFTATDVSTALNTAAGTLNDIKADYVDIAPAFDSTATYTAGDLVEYQGIIYRCTNDHTGDWDADDFSATTIAAEIGALNSNLMNMLTVLTVVSNDSGVVTDINYPNGYNADNCVVLAVAIIADTTTKLRQWGELLDVTNTTGHYVYCDTSKLHLVVRDAVNQGATFNIVLAKKSLASQ